MVERVARAIFFQGGEQDDIDAGADIRASFAKVPESRVNGDCSKESMMTDYANLLKDAAETAPAQWHSKETAPMDGKWCWASDGESVWIVNGHKDGTLRSASAHAVKFWTRDFIPEPPRTETALKQPIATKTNVNERGTEGDSGTNKAG